MKATVDGLEALIGAEAQLDALIRDADATAKQIIEDARRSAYEKNTAVIASLDQRKEELRRKSAADCEREISRITIESERELARYLSLDETRIEQLGRDVVGRLVASFEEAR